VEGNRIQTRSAIAGIFHILDTERPVFRAGTCTAWRISAQWENRGQYTGQMFRAGDGEDLVSEESSDASPPVAE